MTFEEVLPKMRQGYEVGLEKIVEDDIYRINNGEMERLRSDGEWFSTFWMVGKFYPITGM